MDNNALFKGLREIRSNKELCDIVIISAENEIHNAHAVILAAASPVFKVMVTRDFKELRSKEIVLQDISSYIVECMLKFIYGEETSVVTNDNVMELFIQADRLQLQELSKKCQHHIIKEIDNTNCIAIRRLGEKYNCKLLVRDSTKHILHHIETFSKSDEFLNLLLDELTALLKSDELNVSNEEMSLDMVCKWVDHDKSRVKYIPEVMNCCRISLMSLRFIDEKLVQMARKYPGNIRHIKAIFEAYRESKKKYGRKDKRFPCLTASHRLPREIIFLIGGWQKGRTLDMFESYNPNVDEWCIGDEFKDPDRARCYFGLERVNEIIYMLGGYDGRQYLNSVRQFNTKTRRWSRISPMNNRRCFISTVIVHDELYAIAGYDGEHRLSSVEKYCSKTKEWRLLKSLDTPRSDAACVTHNGYIYVLGGYGGYSLCSCEMYDVENNNWVYLLPMNCKRSGACAVVLPNRNKIMVIGGYNGLTRLNTVEIYDIETQNWSNGPSMCQERSNFAACVVGDDVYAIGGYTGYTTVDTVEIYNVTDKKWRFGSYINSRRSAMKAVTMKNISDVKIYFKNGEKPEFKQNNNNRQDHVVKPMS